MKIGLLGDTHGATTWTEKALRTFAERGITQVYQVGDFGFDRKAVFERKIAKLAEELGILLTVIPGNHEDYDYINSRKVEEDGWAYSMYGVRIAPRGHRWELEGRTFVALGGAPSVDRSYRLSLPKKFQFWWAEEAITDEDVKRTADGGHAEVMLAHDAPSVGPIMNMVIQNPHGFLKSDTDYATVGRLKMDDAVAAVKPKVFVHGHYHIPVQTWLQHEDGDTTFVLGLTRDTKNYSLAEMDLDDLSVKVYYNYNEGI
jgi:predicted phosphodiesterase